MEFYKELLINLLQKGNVHVEFPHLEIDVQKIIELECYKALDQIREILRDGALDDTECFAKIEEIVCLFESIGSNGGGRHDF